MYGEGYDFTPLYTPSSGDMVGGLPVGIQTREDNDVPYWPVQATWTYKETWVHPVARWVWLMTDLSGPALVEGQANASVEFKEITTGQKVTVEPNLSTMRFRAMLPEGKYIVRCSGQEQSQTLLPAGTYNLDLRPEKSLSFTITKSITAKGELVIKIHASGMGAHHFNLRTDNLTLSGQRKELVLKPGQAGELEWHASISSKDTPWVAVIVPDDDLSQRKEITGVGWE